MTEDRALLVNGDPEAGSAVRLEVTGADGPVELPDAGVAGAAGEDAVADPADETPDPPAGPAGAPPPASAGCGTGVPAGALAPVGGVELVFVGGTGLLESDPDVALVVELVPPPSPPVIGPRPVWASMKLPLDAPEAGTVAAPPDPAKLEGCGEAPPGATGAADLTLPAPGAPEGAAARPGTPATPGRPARPAEPVPSTGLELAGDRTARAA